VYKGESVLIEGSLWRQVVAALWARRVCEPLPASSDFTLFVHQMTASGPVLKMTWRIDIRIAEGSARAQVYSTRSLIDLEPVPVEPYDNVLAVATKVSGDANAKNIVF
jgi:hypothetical protein